MKTIITLLTFIGAITINAQTFSIDTISDATFQRIYGKSFKHNCNINRSELRYLQLSYYDKDSTEHTGELICNKHIANDLKEIFQELYRLRYPIERMQLIDDFDADDERSMQANNTSCFNYRSIAGSKKLSAHSRGMAVDINPLYNPCVKQRKDGTISIQPSTARKYADRSKKWPYQITIDDPCYRLFIKHGFKWGGNWRSTKDYQHFER
ncbi:MAG: M15 family metallopeptidase [Bacteroidaceae bacterium]|nr:M15 family metallopeptidase [Bacteroidaceae bacterium]